MGAINGPSSGAADSAALPIALDTRFGLELPSRLAALQKDVEKQARQRRGDMAGSVVGAGLIIEGEFTSDEPVVVEGTVRGTLTTGEAVTIGGEGVVEADLSALSVSVAGQVTGNVNASSRVDIQAGGRLIGDVKAARLTIADGASFRGNVDMDV
jgi:cytoskeletal protein CcmA (bactofilin family)